MTRTVAVVLCLSAAACSGASPSAPSPLPSQSPLTVTGLIADTVSGAVIGQFTQAVTGLPARVTVSHPGYVTRETWIATPDARVDLFPEAGFDLGFYRQFARGALDGPAQPLKVLAQSPSIYMQTAGLRDSTVAAYRAAAEATLPALSGGRLVLAGWDTGATVRTAQSGWIVVELAEEPDQAACGRAIIGASSGRIVLNTAQPCRRNGDMIGPSSLFAHELGHALGFWHVDTPGSLMAATVTQGHPSALERHHAALAYTRTAGNTDVDVDSQRPASSAYVVID